MLSLQSLQVPALMSQTSADELLAWLEEDLKTVEIVEGGGVVIDPEPDGLSPPPEDFGGLSSVVGLGPTVSASLADEGGVGLSVSVGAGGVVSLLSLTETGGVGLSVSPVDAGGVGLSVTPVEAGGVGLSVAPVEAGGVGLSVSPVEAGGVGLLVSDGVSVVAGESLVVSCLVRVCGREELVQEMVLKLEDEKLRVVIVWLAEELLLGWPEELLLRWTEELLLGCTEELLLG